jgi:hypothetical protein
MRDHEWDCKAKEYQINEHGILLAEGQSKTETVQRILGTGYQQPSRLPYKTPKWNTPQKGERYIPIRHGKESQYHLRVY